MPITFDQKTPSWDSWTGLADLPGSNATADTPRCGLTHDGWSCTRPDHPEFTRHLAGGSDDRVFHAWPGFPPVPWPPATEERPPSREVAADYLLRLCTTCQPLPRT